MGVLWIGAARLWVVEGRVYGEGVEEGAGGGGEASGDLGGLFRCWAVVCVDWSICGGL